MSSSSKGATIVLPKPCLKHAAYHAQNVQKHAHFPPPSEEAKRYSGIEYDRTPIAIATNELALPARGCPGRTFDDLDAYRYRSKKLRCPKQKQLHILEGAARPSDLVDVATMTPLVADFSRVRLAPGSGQLPSLVHGDTSESEEGELTGLSSSEGETLRRHPVLVTELGRLVASEPAKRLRKSKPKLRDGPRRMFMQRTTSEPTVSSPTTTFSSTSCLGGF